MVDRPRRVLVVEDDPDGRESLRMMLQLWGHKVEVADDGQEGVHKALEYRPEIGLIDIGLPVLDGYEVARRLRSRLGPDTFLVAMTGYGQPHDHRRALEAGFDTYLVKPVDPETLQRLLDQPGSDC